MVLSGIGPVAIDVAPEHRAPGVVEFGEILVAAAQPVVECAGAARP